MTTHPTLRPWAPDHRAPLTPAAVRAGYRAHGAAEHHGAVHGGVGLHCRTCPRYLAGIARAAERVTISACRGATTDPAPPAGTDANTAPNANGTSPHCDGPAQDCAPNACASNGRE